MSDRFLAFAFVAALLHPAGALGAGEPACHEPPPRSPIAGESIGLVYGPEIGRDVVDEAITLWRSCPNHRSDFPALLHGQGTATITLVLAPGNSGSKRCGSFRGRTITLYRWARTSDRSVRSCGSLALNLAHELGHALGLADAHERPGCSRTIMADLEEGNLFRRDVTAEECRLAGERWRTLVELALDADPVEGTAPSDRPAQTLPAQPTEPRRPRE